MVTSHNNATSMATVLRNIIPRLLINHKPPVIAWVLPPPSNSWIKSMRGRRGGVPRTRVRFWGVPIIIRILGFWGLYWVVGRHPYYEYVQPFILSEF